MNPVLWSWSWWERMNLWLLILLQFLGNRVSMLWKRKEIWCDLCFMSFPCFSLSGSRESLEWNSWSSLLFSPSPSFLLHQIVLFSYCSSVTENKTRYNVQFLLLVNKSRNFSTIPYFTFIVILYVTCIQIFIHFPKSFNSLNHYGAEVSSLKWSDMSLPLLPSTCLFLFLNFTPFCRHCNHSLKSYKIEGNQAV